MTYTAYVSNEEYAALGYSNITQNLSKKLKEASQNVDLLTFNRIAGITFSDLTEYQKYAVKECVCEIADFYEENADMIESILQSYSINGVSMQFGESWNIAVTQGVALKRGTYRKLVATGLCRAVI